MNLGKRILNIRKEKEMSQEQFGSLFHVTRQTVSNWENEKSYPDLQMLLEISSMFDISLDSLLKEDTCVVKKIDKERHYGKLSKILLILLAVLLLVIGIGIKIFLDAFDSTPDGERNVSAAGVTLYLNFPDATPSRAIVRTYPLKEYENFNSGRLNRIQDTVGGKIEGDIPSLHVGTGIPENRIIRPVFQYTHYENVLPDFPPEITVKEYCGGGILPGSDAGYNWDIKEWTDVMSEDDAGYYFEFPDYSNTANEELMNPCLIKITCTIDNQEYISVSAFNILY